MDAVVTASLVITVACSLSLHLWQAHWWTRQRFVWVRPATAFPLGPLATLSDSGDYALRNQAAQVVLNMYSSSEAVKVLLYDRLRDHSLRALDIADYLATDPDMVDEPLARAVVDGFRTALKQQSVWMKQAAVTLYQMQSGSVVARRVVQEARLFEGMREDQVVACGHWVWKLYFVTA